MVNYDDDTIRKELAAIDNDETVEVDSWEADFIENILFKWTGSLTANQARTAINIIEKYER